MRVNLRAPSVELPSEARARIVRRLYFALDRFEPHLDRVTVVLSDLNGPRHGVDKRCVVSVHLRSGADVVIKEQDCGVDAACDRACDRLGQAVQRELSRKREQRRRLPRDRAFGLN